MILLWKATPQDTEEIPANWTFHSNELKLLREQFRVDIETDQNLRNVSCFKYCPLK